MIEQEKQASQYETRRWLRETAHEIFGSNMDDLSKPMTFRDFVYYPYHDVYKPMVLGSIKGAKRLLRKLVH